MTLTRDDMNGPIDSASRPQVKTESKTENCHLAELGSLVAKRPSDCTPDEIRAFINVAVKGGEVMERDIERGAKHARCLLWIDESGTPLAVAALKKPFESYRKNIIDKSGAALPTAQFPYEFGYAYTEEKHRRRGYGKELLEKALEVASPDGVYATLRADNDSMCSLLKKNSFIPSGHEYDSTNRDAKIVIYAKVGDRQR